ncbi:MAG: biotin/lipoyl-binding protein [Candidatus Omnitrophica bacterium]|nr:biotin/lipoyl-binding protein [Candidatus Omnitrophota bacterium]
MVEVVFEGVGPSVEEGTVQTWFFEEGDSVSEGDDLVELVTEEGTVMIQAPSSGILTEVYYDEGEIVAKGEVLCAIDNEESALEDIEEDKPE